MDPEALDIFNRRDDPARRDLGRRGVRFLELRLEGFGSYAKPTRFIFPPLLGIDVRPNEEGKSTVLNGLTAVLFGLPRTSDRDEFGTARFQSWEESRGFSGGVDLLADGRRYSIERDFETHKTRIVSLDSDEMVLYEGEANPRGQTSGIHRYREILGELFPVTDIDLFRSVYCVEQPMPEESRISHEVQRLLTGAGVAAGEGVLSILFQRFKSISSKTRDAGIHKPGKRPTDQHTDGRLDACQKKLAELETMIREGEDHFARLIDLERDVQRLTNHLDGVRARRHDAQTVLEKLNSYRDHSSQWERLRQRRAELNRALETHDAHAEERQKHVDRLTSKFPHLADAPADLTESLAEAMRSHGLLQSARAEREQIEEEITRVHAELESVKASLQESPSLAGRSEGLWASLERRESLRHLIQETKTALEEVSEKIARIERDSPEDAPWSLFPRPPDLWIRSTKSKGDSFLEKWKHWTDLTDRRTVIESSMKHWEPLLAPELESEDIPSLQISWKGLVRGVVLAREQEKVQIARLADAEKNHARSLLTRKLLAAAGGLVAGFVAGFLMTVLASSPMAGSAALGVVIALITYATFGRPTSFREERLALQDAVRRAEKERIEAERALQEFQLRWDSLVVALNLPNVDQGGLAELTREYRQSMDAVQKLESVKLLQSQLGKDIFGRTLAKDENWKELLWESMSQDTQDLATFAGVMADAAPADVDALASWLSELDPRKWQEWEAEAARWAEDRRKLINYATIKDMHLGMGATAGLPQFEAEFRRLEEVCRPIPSDADLAELEPRWRNVRKMEERRRSLEARHEELNEALRLAQASEDEATRVWEPWERSLGPYLEATDGDLQLLSNQWQEASRLRGKTLEAERLRDGALSILEGIDNTLTGLKEALRLVEDQADFHRREMQALEKASDTVAHYVTLPSGEERDGYRRRLGEELANLQLEEGALERKLNEARIDLGSLGGSDMPPLAQLELELQEIRQEISQLESRKESILEAWRIMKEVVEELPDTYRPPLSKGITLILSTITKKSDRQVELTSDLELKVLEGKHPCSMEQLSQGARDQLALAVRLAVAGQVGGDAPLPMLFDDPFVNFDIERIENLRQGLIDLAQGRQILIWTHDERLGEWGPIIRQESI